MTETSAAGGKPLTSSVFYILLALADSDRHGLGIAADVEQRTDGDVQLGPGTLYNATKEDVGRWTDPGRSQTAGTER